MSVLDAFSLSGKVSVVTGANRGIGRALVTALAEAGSDVVLLVRDTGGAAEVIAELNALGVTAIAVMADVTEGDQVRRAVGEVLDRLGQVDVLVNNAGACIHRPSLEVTAEEWDFVIDVNVNGVWHCCQEFGRQMVAPFERVKFPPCRGFGLHEAQAAHDEVAHGVHRVVMLLDNFAVLVTCIKPELLPPVAHRGEDPELAG